MNTERLHHLITIMQQVIEHDKQFDMEKWIEPKAPLCGTTCCALGWATLDQQCMADGLQMLAYWRLTPDDDCYLIAGSDLLAAKADGALSLQVLELTTPAAWAQVKDALQQGLDVNFAPYFNDNFGFEAGMEYYQISDGQTNYLFDPSGYDDRKATPIDVIVHIREVLVGYDPDYDPDEA